MGEENDRNPKRLIQRWRKNPLLMAQDLWPDVYFYEKQKKVIESVWHNKETIVTAGNMLGKDFVAGFIVLAFFTVHDFTRIVTTSVKDDHLDVLWGEINKFIIRSNYPSSKKTAAFSKSITER